ASEFLKANLRQGVVVRPWVYSTLAIALKQAGASAEEIERASVSAADLEPGGPEGFLSAARALSEAGQHPRALAFCKQAALLSPGLPHAYDDALGYAELAADGPAMAWAAGSLLKRDWPLDNAGLHARAKQKVDALARALRAKGKKDQADVLVK